MSRGGLLLRRRPRGRRARIRARRGRRRARAPAAEAAAAAAAASREPIATSWRAASMSRSMAVPSADPGDEDTRRHGRHATSGSPTCARCSGRSCGLTKGDLLRYYADVSPTCCCRTSRDRAMVMKRYPHGAAGEFFFMKRAPTPRPDVDRDLLDRARLGQRHRIPDDPGSRVAAVGRSISAASI